ncbi:NADH-quinone oxidoreductase subunit C [Roseibium sp. CAU 1637]|uniref:NADH-quinone oxidoreductase subunit C n=1 Tax=Roseibium limicola TaxID=2816037 RepID=A0A939J5Y4_9HYPH|nr:NADH-quinone oxidoreductase subunit C [Roseibium limicola]MBO0344557.1 NADH-quinone oxidoreductase subunit C [Roseibium limicola]
MDETLKDLAEHITLSLGSAVLSSSVEYGELTLEVGISDVLEAVRFLRDNSSCKFVNITDLCGVDYPSRDKRFDVVYHFLSPMQNQRIRIKVATDDDTPVPSITGLFPGAEWFEREAYDMYGILFSGHPDLRRILTDYGFDGFPLRKDFPVTGYVELRYDDEKKRVVYEPVRLNQEMRNFDFLSPWEGTDYVLPGDEKAS